MRCSPSHFSVLRILRWCHTLTHSFPTKFALRCSATSAQPLRVIFCLFALSLSSLHTLFLGTRKPMFDSFVILSLCPSLCSFVPCRYPHTISHTHIHTHTLSSSSFTNMAAVTGDKRPDSRRLADFATKVAETFVSAYYAASDSPQRTNLVPTLYLPTSSIVWNGTPVSGQQELTAMLNSMPGSKHELNAFDCHALGGAVDGGKYDF